MNKMFDTNKILTTNKISGIKNSNKSIEKFVKPKSKKLFKLKKLLKFQNLAKSKKKLSKSENLSNFDTKEIRSSFFTSIQKGLLIT